MRREPLEQASLDAVLAATGRARRGFDDAHAWLVRAVEEPMAPVSAEVWAFAPGFEHVLLVLHRWRGRVCPGGCVEPGEGPRAAAVRELREETGLRAEVSALPAAVWVRSYRADWSRPPSDWPTRPSWTAVSLWPGRAGVDEAAGEVLSAPVLAERVGWAADLVSGMASSLLGEHWNASDVHTLAQGVDPAGHRLPANAWMALRRLGWSTTPTTLRPGTAQPFDNRCVLADGPRYCREALPGRGAGLAWSPLSGAAARDEGIRHGRLVRRGCARNGWDVVVRAVGAIGAVARHRERGVDAGSVGNFRVVLRCPSMGSVPSLPAEPKHEITGFLPLRPFRRPETTDAPFLPVAVRNGSRRSSPGGRVRFRGC